MNRQPRQNDRARYDNRGRPAPRPGTYGGGETVSSAVKASLLARSGKHGARHVKECELAALLVAEPELATRHGELLAELPFSDQSLDRLRQQLLNLAASGSRLDKQGLEHHLGPLGMAELVARLSVRAAGGDPISEGEEPADIDTRFLRAASDLREMAEREPERARAMERFKNEGTEESWVDARKLLGPSD